DPAADLAAVPASANAAEQRRSTPAQRERLGRHPRDRPLAVSGSGDRLLRGSIGAASRPGFLRGARRGSRGPPTLPTRRAPPLCGAARLWRREAARSGAAARPTGDAARSESLGPTARRGVGLRGREALPGSGLALSRAATARSSLPG